MQYTLGIPAWVTCDYDAMHTIRVMTEPATMMLCTLYM